MHQNEDLDFFLYHPPKNVKSMPLDFDQREIAAYWEEILPNSEKRNKIRPEMVNAYIWSNELFRQFYQDYLIGHNSDPHTPVVNSTLRWEQDSPLSNALSELFLLNDKKPVTKIRKVIPIPCEAEPFFRDYFAAVVTKGEKTDEESPRHLRADFGQKFLSNVRHTIAQDPDAYAYYEKALFLEPAFCQFVAEDYWNTEFDKRCNTLKEYAKQCPPETQLIFLKEILEELDHYIEILRISASVNKPRTTHHNRKDTTSFLTNFPTFLLKTMRMGIEQEQNEDEHFLDIDVTGSDYLLENVHFEADVGNGMEDFTLQAFFLALEAMNQRPITDFDTTPHDPAEPEKERTKRLKKAKQTKIHKALTNARKAYLTLYGNRFVESDFYQQCKKLDAFLADAQYP